MKKLFFLTFIVALCASNSIAQWAPNGAKWYYDHYPQTQSYLTVIESVKDTLILSKNCKILKSYMIYIVNDSYYLQHWDTLYCPLQYSYYDNSKVYLYDDIIEDFYLLYDFNALKDDTITVKNTPFDGYCPEDNLSMLFEYKIDSISDTLIGGISLNMQYVSPTQNADWAISGFYQNYNFPIIERIGSLKYMFGLSSEMEGSISNLRCYQDETLLYKAKNWPEAMPCNYLIPLQTNISKNKYKPYKVVVYPNPAKDYILFKFLKQLCYKSVNISIFNSKGNLLFSEIKFSENNEFKMNCSNLVNGFYFYKISDLNNKILDKGTFIVNY